MLLRLEMALRAFLNFEVPERKVCLFVIDKIRK